MTDNRPILLSPDQRIMAVCILMNGIKGSWQWSPDQLMNLVQTARDVEGAVLYDLKHPPQPFTEEVD